MFVIAEGVEIKEAACGKQRDRWVGGVGGVGGVDRGCLSGEAGDLEVGAL